MKKILFIFGLLASIVGSSQSTYYIRADSTRLEKVGGSNNLILLNTTRSMTGGYLKNVLNGRTAFSYAGDSMSISGANLTMWRGAGTQNVTVAIPSSGGTVTSVTGNLPITVATGTTTPVIGIGGLTTYGTASQVMRMNAGATGLEWGTITVPTSADYWATVGNTVGADTKILGTLDNFPLRIRTNNTEKVTVLGNGNVGIGSTNPLYKLHIENNTNGLTLGGLFNTSTGANAGTAFFLGSTTALTEGTYGEFFYNNSNAANTNQLSVPNRMTLDGSGTGGVGILAHDAGGYIALSTGGFSNSNERMRVTATGNVGIGTTSPAASSLLDITSTTKGLLIPRMTGAQRTAITPAAHLLVSQTGVGTTSAEGMYGYIASNWRRFLTDADSTALAATAGRFGVEDATATQARTFDLQTNDLNIGSTYYSAGVASGIYLQNSTSIVAIGDGAVQHNGTVIALRDDTKYIRITADSVLLQATNIKMQALPTGASTDSIVTYDPATNKIRKRNASSIVGATPTFQQTLTAGSTLTTNNTIAGGSTNWAHNTTGNYAITGSGGVAIKNSDTVFYAIGNDAFIGGSHSTQKHMIINENRFSYQDGLLGSDGAYLDFEPSANTFNMRLRTHGTLGSVFLIDGASGTTSFGDLDGVSDGRLVKLDNGDFYIKDNSLTAANNGNIWTLNDDATGEGEWAENINIGGTLTTAGVNTLSNLAGTGSRTVLADASGVLTAPVSDISVKEFITPLSNGVETIMKLKPVSFEYKTGWKNYGEGKQIGFIAQDINTVLPNSTFITPTTGKMGYDANDIIPVLTQALKEQQAMIEALLKRIEALEKNKK